MPVVPIPYKPRPLQREIHAAMKRFNVLNLHRRFGKTVFAVNQLIRDVLECPLPNPRGYYFAPYYSQAKKIAWEYVRQFTQTIPGIKYNESELRVDFPNGGRIQLGGADNPHSHRGIYADSIVLDEYAQMHPIFFPQIIRPALSDRQGKCLFIGTPQGMANQFYRVYEQAAQFPETWYRRTINVEESGYISGEELAQVKAELAPEEYEQEMMCSWSAAIKGAYYASEMHLAEEEKRITHVPYDESYPVITSWDLGVKDATVVWYWQVVGLQIRAIRCEAFQGMKLTDIIKQVDSHGYRFSQHIALHDINVRELGEGSRIRQARRLGVKFDVAPPPAEMTRQSGINAVRNMLSRCVFDRELCRDGIEALKNYRTEYNEKREVFSNNPLHDWSSDYADSVRYFAITRHKTEMHDYQNELDYTEQDRAVY